MPKIKDLSNDQLKDYHDAYLSMQSTDPNNEVYKRKIKCIIEALHSRDLINFDLPGSKTRKNFFQKIASIFKRNK